MIVRLQLPSRFFFHFLFDHSSPLLFQRCLVHVTFSPRMDPNMVRQEAVRVMEREAEAERKRLELASPPEKPQEQNTGQVRVLVSNFSLLKLLLATNNKCFFVSTVQSFISRLD